MLCVAVCQSSECDHEVAERAVTVCGGLCGVRGADQCSAPAAGVRRLPPALHSGQGQC